MARVCFRGKGLRITEKEKNGWNKFVHVRFQPKAWYDEKTCLAWATQRGKEITAEARQNGRDSVLLLDNLPGHATEECRKTLREKSNMVVHLLPAGVTDLVQLVDASFGYLVKHFAGIYQAEWMVDHYNASDVDRG